MKAIKELTRIYTCNECLDDCYMPRCPLYEEDFEDEYADKYKDCKHRAEIRMKQVNGDTHVIGICNSEDYDNLIDFVED